jgi:hypothetical protein
VFAPDGNLITSNGDAVNPDPTQPSEIVEFTKSGKFVAPPLRPPLPPLDRNHRPPLGSAPAAPEAPFEVENLRAGAQCINPLDDQDYSPFLSYVPRLDFDFTFANNFATRQDLNLGIDKVFNFDGAFDRRLLASEVRHVVDDVVNAVLPVDGRRPNLGRLRVRAMLGTLTVLDFGVATSRARYSGLTAAHSSALEPCAAERWIAVGDAGLSFDPLSAQGLLHAPFTGLAAAEAADAYLPATAKRRPGRNAQGPRPLSGQKRRGSLHRNAAWRIALINIPRKCASEPRRS